ncbi:MAG: chromosome partitioning protein ParB [Nakamurella sp.]
MAETHSHPIPGGRGVWLTERLWTAAAGLPVRRVRIADIPEFDQDCWFNGVAPTCRQVAEHAARILAADVNYPVILAANGGLMDGGHRVARAFMNGEHEVDAVRFERDPEPD